MESILVVCLVIAGIVFYFLPAVIANKKRNANAIMLINMFFGWTGLLWLVCLIWAICDKRKGF